MSANSVLRVTDINFNNIKNNLKDFLSSQSEFNDYDFESSTLNILLDILAYNTYQQAFYLNMVGNEMFLDSGLIRNNVISRAKMLGYVPRSFTGASATIQMTVTPDDNPTKITVAKNTAFTSTIDGETFTFVVPVQTFINDVANTFSANVSVVQGEPLTHKFTVSTSTPVRYIIPNEQVDTQSIGVIIQESSSNTSVTTYKKINDTTTIMGNTAAFFIQENENSRFEVFFGDGVIGKKPINGNIVIVDYRITEGSKVNGANNFSAVSTIGGYSSFSLSTSVAAAGGANLESITSIKYNAPKVFESQNRLVTKNDYKSTILNENGDVGAVAVWGGEDNSPPSYGKVFIAMKPLDGNIVADEIKENIASSLSTRNILSIEPVFVDPTFLYIVPTITVRYNPDLTSLSAGEIATKISNKIITYETDNLTKFDTKFFHSKFIKAVDSADTSIQGSLVDILLQKRFVPITTTSTAYTLPFNNAISNPHGGHLFSVSTSFFTLGTRTEAYYDDDGNGLIRSYFLRNNVRTYISTNVGLVDYGAGIVTLDNQRILAYNGSEVKVNAVPKESNVFSVRNQILLIADVEINVIDDSSGITVATLKDIATSGQTAALLQSQSDAIIY